ncbi:MAG: TonB-dependent receptor [Betaproteobacteria bacterium]
MYGKSVLAVALTIAAAGPFRAVAADDSDLAQIRDQIRQMKEEYESRIRALEQRLQAAEAKTERLAAPSGTASAMRATAAASIAAAQPAGASPRGAQAASNAYNPAIALILGGTYARLTQDPSQYRIQGFIPGAEEIGPGSRNFNLGESELTLSANIDHRFSGQLTFALASDNSVGVEEAFFRANGLAGGTNLMAGRFLSGIGYLNSQHAHAWDFVDAPLAYQAFFGGQYKTDGVQLKWLAPIDRFLEFGLETGRGAEFPGTGRNKNGSASAAAFVHLGDDIGDSASWRVGLSYLRNGAAERAYDDVDAAGVAVSNAFSGHSDTWIADVIYKWSPAGNATQTNLKLQGEYFRRAERGTLTYDTAAQSLGTLLSGYRSTQSGWYAQGVYQFMPQWRAGLRYDKLYSGTPSIEAVDDRLLGSDDFSRLLAYNPSRSTLMVDYAPSEFSRFRVQFARDQSRTAATDHQLFLQYIMSLGVHGAHSF